MCSCIASNAQPRKSAGGRQRSERRLGHLLQESARDRWAEAAKSDIGVRSKRSRGAPSLKPQRASPAALFSCRRAVWPADRRPPGSDGSRGSCRKHCRHPARTQFSDGTVGRRAADAGETEGHATQSTSRRAKAVTALWPHVSQRGHTFSTTYFSELLSTRGAHAIRRAVIHCATRSDSMNIKQTS